VTRPASKKTPALAQKLKVRDGGGVVKHTSIHGGGKQEWVFGSASTEGQGGEDEQVIRQPMCKFRNGVGSGRRDDEHIGGVPQTHMQDVRFCSPEGFIGECRASGDGLEGERG
jgi:hypothetical protein